MSTAYLLNARALPWDLLRLPTVFSSDDPLLRKAASKHLRHAAEHLHFLDEVDFSKTLAEGEYWQDLFRRGLSLVVGHRIDIDRLTIVAG